MKQVQDKVQNDNFRVQDDKFTLKSSETIGILLLNLGGPDSLDAVSSFLYNLFSDREIIRLGPSFLQKPLALLISTMRSPRTRKMYSLIGGKSPLLDITKAQAEALERELNKKSEARSQKSNPPLPPFTKRGCGGINSSLVTPHSSLSFRVYIGMRYWHPFIKDTVNKILGDGIKHIIVLSLYPHYSKATTGSAIAEFKRALSDLGFQISDFRFKYIEQWYDFPPYINALAELISKGISEFNENPPLSPFSKEGDKEGNLFSRGGLNSPLLRGVRGVSTPLAKGGEGGFGERAGITLLYSAHSLPEDFIKQGDPYLDHIKSTITAVNKQLSEIRNPKSEIPKWLLSFQSKSGPVTWLKPTTEETIIKLAKTGVKNLLVVPISFVSDNIETLYEIDILYRGIAEKHGINFKRCETLNTSEKFIESLKELVLRETQMITDEKRR